MRLGVAATAVITLAVAVVAHAQDRVEPLNDTGVDFAGDARGGNRGNCSGADAGQQDCAAGRDALARAGKLRKLGAGPSGFDFVAVCHSGEVAGSGACPLAPAPGANRNDWGCTRDNVSGLEWEVKTADGGVRDRDRTYSNFSPAYDPMRAMGSGVDALGYVKAVNAVGLCGARDWRLPSRMELINLANFGAAPGAPALDPRFFPNPSSDPKKTVVWTATAFAADAHNAWGVDLADGSAGDDNRSIYYGVRLVRRAGPRQAEPTAAASAVHSGAATALGNAAEVRDPGTGLVWLRCAEGTRWSAGACVGTPGAFTWAEALAIARAAGSGWRLPDIKQLASLVDPGRAAPAIDTARFPNAPASWFWSATPSGTDPAYAWYVNFGTGASGPNGYRLDRHLVRLVRDAVQ